MNVNERVTILLCDDFIGEQANVISENGSYLECFTDSGHTVIIHRDDVTTDELKSVLQLFCEQSLWTEPYKSHGKSIMQEWNEKHLAMPDQLEKLNRQAQVFLYLIEREMLKNRKPRKV